MTASATSSSVVLLGNAASTSKPAVSAAAAPSNDADGDGFQLLLARAADTVRATVKQALLSADKTAESDAATAQPASEDGNALPLLAGLLPQLPVTASTNANSDEHKGADGDKTVDPTALLVAPPVLPGLVPVPAQSSNTADSTAADASALQSAVTLGVANGPAPTQPIAPAAATEKSIELLSTPKVTSGTNDATPIAAQDVGVQLSAGAEKSTPQKTDADSDFDTLIKQLDATPPSASLNSTSANTVVDGNRVLHQAARPYAAAGTATATVSVPVNAEGWSDTVTDKVMWFSANKINSAEIHLNPPDLGPLQVRISTQQDQTSVVFSSPHAAVRDALDQALPRLRDMMGGQGLQLLDVGVGGQGAARQQGFHQDNRGNADAQGRSANGFFGDSTAAAEPVAITAVTAARLTRSSIDAYV